MTEEKRGKPQKRFYSLKWRALLLTSLILITINASFVYLQYQVLLEQFESQRARATSSYTRQLQGLVQQSLERLQQVAGIVPYLNDMPSAIASNEPEQIVEAFDAAWSSLQLDIGLDFAQLYSPEGDLIRGWKSWNMQFPQQSRLNNYVSEVQRSERPIELHECLQQCTEYVFVPMLSQGRYAGTVVLGKSLTSVILGFNSTSGIDIGVLSRVGESENKKTSNDRRVIKSWKMKVTALTDLDQNLPLIRTLAEQESVDKLSGGYLFEDKGKYYDIRLLQEELSKGSDASFVLIDDISEGVHRINAGYRKSIATGVFGLVVSEGLLLLILWRPLSRLRLTALALPLLAQNAFSSLQQRIDDIRVHKRWFSDEFEVLNDTIVEVAYRMETMQQQLKQRNAELTSANVQMKKYTVILERRNRELQRFAQIASHDLQEPLRMISSYLQMLERRYKGKLDDDADEFIDYAVNGAKRLQNLIIAISEYYQVLTRAKPFQKIDMEQVLYKVLEDLSHDVEKTGANITHDTLPVIMGDAAQLRRVFKHLVDNALTYRRESEAPQIHIGVERKDDAWCFSIKDNGLGFEPQYSERIFAIFQVLHTQHDYSGTGIGLAICKRIIEDHGGQIWAESNPGEGATFYFTIPITGE